jgi:hypothetical protein
MEGSLPLASRADTRPVADPHRVDCTANGGELDIGELHESRYTEHPGNTGLPDHAHAYNATDRYRTAGGSAVSWLAPWRGGPIALNVAQTVETNAESS